MDDYLDEEILFEKLRPEFKSGYGIDSCRHPYLYTMTCMFQRKIPVVCSQKHIKFLSQCLNRLITLKPYVKRTDSLGSILKRLREIREPQYDMWQSDPASAVNIFRGSILYYWEPQFHPLIREGHKKLLKTIACQLALADDSVPFKPLEPHPGDFLEHLRPYACMYIKRKKKEFEYSRIEGQVGLHEEFDNYLATGKLDHRINEFSCPKDDFEFAANDSVWLESVRASGGRGRAEDGMYTELWNLCWSAGHGTKFTYSTKRLALKLMFQEDIEITPRYLL